MYRYSVVIADDEIANVNGVSALLAMKCPEVYVTAKFDNGRDVIEYLKHNHTDIAILDIKMPLADGLDVAEYIYNNKIDTSIIMMTGYREFEYTKRAINAKVSAFIEKPIDMKYTVEKIHEICRERGKKVREQIMISHSVIEENNRFNQDLKLFYFGAYPFEIINDKYNHKYNFDNGCAIVTFSLDNETSYDETFWKDIGQIENNKTAVFLLANYGSSAKFLVLSLKDDSEQEIKKYAEETKLLFEYPSNAKCRYNIEWYKNLRNINIQKIAETANLMMESLIFSRENDTELINDIISYYSPNLLYDFMGVFLDKISENIDMDKEQYMTRASAARNSSELLRLIREIEDLFIKSISIDSEVIEEIKQFLKDNCGRQISLKSVAEKFAFNYSYLSRLFKEKIGMNFSDFMVFIRVEKAKELFAEGKYKVDEVASMVGYNRQSYFAELFKKLTGVTPSQYVALQRLKNEDV
ncbi:MAG: response regulator [Clostridia bacterium]|nr:response regulator [Clostridia bacterium]